MIADRPRPPRGRPIPITYLFTKYGFAAAVILASTGLFWLWWKMRAPNIPLNYYNLRVAISISRYIHENPELQAAFEREGMSVSALGIMNPPSSMAVPSDTIHVPKAIPVDENGNDILPSQSKIRSGR